MGTTKPRCPTCGPYHSERRHALLAEAYSDDPPLTGATLQAVRLAARVSRRELARSLGYTARTVKAWELGQRPIPSAVWLAAPGVLDRARTRVEIAERHQYQREVSQRRRTPKCTPTADNAHLPPPTDMWHNPRGEAG